MGLEDKINQLKAEYEAGKDVALELAKAYIRMAERKNSQSRFWWWIEELVELLEEEEVLEPFTQRLMGLDIYDCEWRVLQEELSSERGLAYLEIYLASDTIAGYPADTTAVFTLEAPLGILLRFLGNCGLSLDDCVPLRDAGEVRFEALGGTVSLPNVERDRKEP